MCNIDKYIVYKHTTPSGKVYIGITKKKKARDRWRYGFGYKHNPHFYNAILKYGWDNIDHQILASGLSLEEACNMEKELIAFYAKEGICYNVAAGGMDGNVKKRTDAEREHLSKFFKEYFKTHRHPLQDTHCSEEAKEKIRAANKKRWADDYKAMYDTVVIKVPVGVYNILTSDYMEFDSEKEAAIHLKIKPTTFRRHADNGSLYNRCYVIFPLSSLSLEEALQKAYNREKLNIHCGGQEIPVVQLDIEGNYLNRYSSIKEAANKTGINISGIGGTCRKKRKQSGGYLWMFEHEYIRRH